MICGCLGMFRKFKEVDYVLIIPSGYWLEPPDEKQMDIYGPLEWHHYPQLCLHDSLQSLDACPSQMGIP